MIEYVVKLLKWHNIEVELKNPSKGLFYCWRKKDGKLYRFYATTGKIMGRLDISGIDALIRELENA